MIVSPATAVTALAPVVVAATELLAATPWLV
jgi:hypothetical protein